jgi:class 3 adenylate cyclase
MMNALRPRMDAASLEHGGRIDEHTGDGVMAIWGGTRHARATGP